MGIIQLNQSLINKIAAGEVVERPLSVVKELTENAVDAGASMITVEIADGGLSTVRVTDNGGGISPEDLPLAFARHATSKIASFDDLMQVRTLGFRGEALSSIAAVSQVEMVTKTPMAMAGTQVVIHGGKLVSSREIGCANGTTIIVSNLFYNTPARRKFLKKPATEAGYISHCLERLALGNPDLTLRYINNGQIVFQTNGTGNLKAALLSVYGRQTAEKTVSVDATAGNWHLSGLAGKPETARGNRRHGSFFINGRYIESALISRAVESAMKTMLPSGRFPLYALTLTMPPEEMDVNVHPTKMDVRFADEDGVFGFIEGGVRDALEDIAESLIPAGGRRRSEVRGWKLEEEQKPEPEQIALPLQRSEVRSRRSEVAPRAVRAPALSRAPTLPRQATAATRISSAAPTPAQSALAEVAPLILREVQHERTRPDSRNIFTDYTIHCLLFETYWLISKGDSMYLIDRHAAHERVLYEEFLSKAEEEDIRAQNLLSPIRLRLTPAEKQTLQDNRRLFARFGFEVSDDFESPEILSVPFLMKGPVSGDFFIDLLDKIGEAGFKKDSPYTHKTEMIAMAACKAAVKAGDAPTEEEARTLVQRLLELSNPFTCPHGRPTIIEITKKELERRFMRT